MDPNVIGAEHYGVARGVQKILQVLIMIRHDYFAACLMPEVDSGGNLVPGTVTGIKFIC
jgi:F0F1-type ATP synthase beta subunit